MDRHPDWSSTKRTCAKGPEEIKRTTSFTDDMQLFILRWWSFTFVQHFVENRTIFRRTGRILQQILVNIVRAHPLSLLRMPTFFHASSYRPTPLLSSLLSDFCILCICAIKKLLQPFSKKSHAKGGDPPPPFNISEEEGGLIGWEQKGSCPWLPASIRLRRNSFFLYCNQITFLLNSIFGGQLIWLFIFPSILRLFVQDQTYILPNPVVANIWKLFIGGICFCCPE